MQDPKYITGPIFNSATGEQIPLDEPIFLFRARDRHAVTVLEFYTELVDGPDDEEHREAVRLRVEEFYSFRYNHPDRMKQPDTDLVRQGAAVGGERNERTSDEVGSIASRLIRHSDPEVRRLAASCLTQRPDRG